MTGKAQRVSEALGQMVEAVDVWMWETEQNPGGEECANKQFVERAVEIRTESGL